MLFVVRGRRERARQWSLLRVGGLLVARRVVVSATSECSEQVSGLFSGCGRAAGGRIGVGRMRVEVSPEGRELQNTSFFYDLHKIEKMNLGSSNLT